MGINRLRDYNRIANAINKRYEVWNTLKKKDLTLNKEVVNSVLKEYRFLIKTLEEKNE